MNAFQTKILRVFRSPKFFIAILVLFVLESVWIAISAAYPMVFDENTHFGIIKLHAQQWSPIFTHQPPHAEFAGALTRDPSYLYHYLLSFPYRLIAQFTDSQMTQIIFLRLINVVMFGIGLLLFRKLLSKTKVSPAIINVTILFFVLTPVVPLLAGQINYDNLLFPVTALFLLIAVGVSGALKKGILPLKQSILLLIVGLLGSLVQFAFLPAFVAVVLWLAGQAWMAIRHNTIQLSDTAEQWSNLSWNVRLGLLVPLILSAGLFTQMYGVNIVKYHNPVVQCNQVLTEQQCSLNAAWERNHVAQLNNNGTADTNPVLYSASWSYRMFVAMFYTSSGGASPTAWYLSINPLPVVFITAIAVFAGGLLLVVRYHRSLFHGYNYLGMLLFVSGFYCFMLWARNYHDFVNLGEKVAINGRYLFPILLPLMLIVALAYRQLLAEKHHLKVGLVVAVFVLFLQGGGALTYISSSKNSLYWHNHAIVSLNQGAQKFVRPLIIIKTPIKSFGSVGG